MAFGFSPKYIQDYQLDNLNKEHFLVLAIEAAFKLDWDVSFVSETGFIAYTKFSWSSWSEEVTIKMDNNVANIKSECTESQLVDWGKNKKNVEVLLSKIEEVKSMITQEEIEAKIEDLRQGYASKEDDILSKPPSTTKEKITDFFSIFKPTEGYFVSPILININLLVFIVMLISGVHILLPENQDLLNWGANFRPRTLEGQWWRLFTACFLHIGILHLLLNMYALLYIGLLLEPYLGKTRFLAAYLISGIAASMTSLWWYGLTISAGASGAIFGMYGVFLALLTTNLLDKSVKKALLTSIAVFVGYNILNGLKPNSGIDNAAHIGGLLSGLVIGYAFIPSLKQFENKAVKFSTIGALTIALLISSFTVYKSLPNDIGQYEKEMERFVSMEAMALEIYNLREGTPNEELLSEIKDRGLYYWNENIKLIDSFKDLDLPLPIRARNSKLKEYCELRIKSYELIYKAIDEDTDKYENEINEYIQKIETTITELTGSQ
ncbi:rhomboid protease GluP [Algoriphagus sp. 4150]|uniref:rhomboid family intramembrane serine protease n=1 Tax=Algoriphagus sp. 4150 TaxID=2817756 RepID=UPI0028622ABC|nr:rhomboid family intramembrane serine protease [Algoriphagus sp. 4150]MDR7129743.1 rhomboid protease GluP [Algoriphagus sp. 4150]